MACAFAFENARRLLLPADLDEHPGVQASTPVASGANASASSACSWLREEEARLRDLEALTIKHTPASATNAPPNTIALREPTLATSMNAEDGGSGGGGDASGSGGAGEGEGGGDGGGDG